MSAYGKAYRQRIKASKANLDAEMRAFAAAHPGDAAALIARFPAIDRDYARELTRR